MSLLCATDFSPCAQSAADVAALLAKKLNLSLRLVHCGHDLIVMGELPVAMPDNESLIRQLKAEAKRLRDAGADVIEEFRCGDPAGELVAAAKEQATEMIVLGSTGGGLAARWLLGSVTEDVAENAPAPTLIVRQPDTLRTWLQNGAALELLCGVDMAGASAAAVSWVKKLAGVGEVRIGAVHVQLDEPATDPAAERLARERDVWDKLHAGLGDLPLTVHVLEPAGSPPQPFLDLAREKGAGLVVVGSRQRHGWKRLKSSSFSRRVLARAETNVLCVPADKTVSATSVPVIQRVLVAVDLEESAADVLRHAHSLLPAEGAVRLVHVCHEPARGASSVATTELYVDFAAVTAKAREEAGQKIKALPAALLNVPGVQVTSEVLAHDDIAAAICAAAERFGADVICMGTKGHSRIASALLGSVVQGVLARAHIPVFVVTPPIT